MSEPLRTIQILHCPNCGIMLPRFYYEGKYRCPGCKKVLLILPVRTVEGNRLGIIENEYFVIHYHVDFEMIERV